MPKTLHADTQTEHTYAEEVARLDNSNPADWRDATHVRAIIAAQADVASAEDKLRQAVAAARLAGDPWVIVGAALGITRQAAQQRFGNSPDTTEGGVPHAEIPSGFDLVTSEDRPVRDRGVTAGRPPSA